MNSESVTVFVDDYVTGRFPGICAVSGEPTADSLTMRTEIDGPSGALILLFFLGPIGWLILLVVAASGQRSHLTGTLPLSEMAHIDLRRNRRAAGIAAVGGLALLLIGVVGFAGPITGIAAMVGAILIIGGLIRFGIVDSGYPRIELDGSRRWVTISRAHANFVAAVTASTTEASEAAADLT